MRTVVVSLRERADRRNALDLPFPYDVILQRRFGGGKGVSWAKANAGCALAHRSAVARAKNEGWPCVLVLEDDAVLYDEGIAVDESLATHPITLLGGNVSMNFSYDIKTQCVTDVTGSHAVLYRADSYAWILAEFPSRTELRRGRAMLSSNPYDYHISGSLRIPIGYRRVFDQLADSPSSINPRMESNNVVPSNDITELLSGEMTLDELIERESKKHKSQKLKP